MKCEISSLLALKINNIVICVEGRVKCIVS